MTTQPAARNRVLAAYKDLLINDGARAATLDAVAAAAGVSKGGLLYHFKSKEALTAGLVQDLRDLAAVDFEAMRTDPAGSAAYYVRTSVFGGTAFDRTIIAAMRLAQDDDTVSAAFTDIHDTWFQLILADVGDPAVARAVMLIGDGLYYDAALFGLPSHAKPPSQATGTDDDDGLEALLGVVERMRGTVRQERA